MVDCRGGPCARPAEACGYLRHSTGGRKGRPYIVTVMMPASERPYMVWVGPPSRLRRITSASTQFSTCRASSSDSACWSE